MATNSKKDVLKDKTLHIVESQESSSECGTPEGQTLRRSKRERVATKKSAEISDDSDEESHFEASKRGKSKKSDSFNEDDDFDGLISSPRRGRPKKRVNENELSDKHQKASHPSPRGRPRKSDVASEDSGILKKTDFRRVISTESLAKKTYSATSTEMTPTPKKQVRIKDEPSIHAFALTQPTNSEADAGVYEFTDALPSSSTYPNKDSDTPEVAMNMSIETQTDEPEHIEVTYFVSSPGHRTVQTQTDPSLKLKKVKHDESLFDDDDDYMLRRRFRYDNDEEFVLFEDSKKRSVRRASEEALKCPFCDKSFIGLVKHIKSRHFQEPEYDDEMRNARWRERIMKGMPDTQGEACTDCGKVTMNMKRHRESHQMDRMQIPCPMCNKIVLKTGLSSHMRTVHSGRKPYKCPHCPYVSAFRGNLNTHVKGMHLHTRQYLCHVCLAAFKTLGALIGHTKRVHEGWKSPNQKIFICSVCEKRFTKKYHVDRHMLIHTGEKPHECDDCGRTFNNKSNLMSHIQLVHKRLSPYQCDLCKETFKRKKLLLEHIGRVHVSQGEHVVFRTPMEEEDEHLDLDESDAPVIQVDGDTVFADGSQVQLATVVSPEEAASLTEGQHYTTLQSETGEETIIIVHSGDVNDVTQAIMNQSGDAKIDSSREKTYTQVE